MDKQYDLASVANMADVGCACLVLAMPLAAALVAAWWRLWPRRSPTAPTLSSLPARVRATALPAQLCRVGLWALAPLVRAMLKMRIAPNTITLLSLLAGIAAGVLLAWGHFGVAGLLFVVASFGDALDGMVARAGHTESPGGALFDASVDRYEEFFAFGGLAIFFRSSGILLTVTLVALAGSFMVSYGSAQAEARHVAVPPGIMRRPERAASLGAGIVLGPIVAAIASACGYGGVARSLHEVPVVVAMAVIGVVANVCAVRRIRAIAAAIGERRPMHAPRVSRVSSSPVTDTVVATAG